MIEKHTPGVVVGVKDGLLRVSFEEGTFLEFAVRGPEPISEPLVVQSGFATPPDPFPGDDPPHPRELRPFVGGSGNYWLLQNEGAAVAFQGKTYDPVGDTSLAHLVISTEARAPGHEHRVSRQSRGRKDRSQGS